MESILDLDATFVEATEVAKDFVNIDTSTMLQLYGFYKQATVGVCCISKPSIFNFTALQKWNAWKAVGSIDSLDAKSKYIELVNTLSGASKNHKTTTQFGVAVSCMLNTEQQLDENDKTIFDWVKDGNCSRVSLILQLEPALISKTDENEMQLLHWAADRGDPAMIQLLG